jgi:YVTN family beta-propeller protein
VSSPAAGLPIAGQLIATVPVGQSPFVVAAGHGAIWVLNDIAGTLSRIDPATNAVVATIQISAPIAPSSPPSELLGLRQARPALAIDATFVWATKPEEQAVVQVDPLTNTVVATIPLEAKATSIASDGSSLWVSLFGASSVTRIDIETLDAVATIADVPTPAGIAVHQDAVWVANYLSDTVTRIDRQTNQVVEQVSVRWPNAPFTGFQCSLCATEILAGDDGVWVSLLTAGVIARIDGTTNRLTAIIPVGIQPNSLARHARGVWVGHKSSTGVLLIDPSTNQVVAAVPATDPPHQLPAIALAENSIWVARTPARDVVRIELHPQ